MSNEDNKKPMNPKREMLIQLSVQAFELREQFMLNANTQNEFEFWENCTINYMLLNHIYKTDGASRFNTFNQWKAENATVKKGSQSFVIWGQPIKTIKKGGAEETQTTDLPPLKEQLSAKYEYWPMCYLFSDNQVVLPQDRKAETNTNTEQDTPNTTIEPIDLEYII